MDSHPLHFLVLTASSADKKAKYHNNSVSFLLARTDLSISNVMLVDLV